MTFLSKPFLVAPCLKRVIHNLSVSIPATEADGGSDPALPGLELPDLRDAEQVLAHQHRRR